MFPLLSNLASASSDSGALESAMSGFALAMLIFVVFVVFLVAAFCYQLKRSAEKAAAEEREDEAQAHDSSKAVKDEVSRLFRKKERKAPSGNKQGEDEVWERPGEWWKDK